MFVEHFGSLMRRLASEIPATRVPSPGECRFCETTPATAPSEPRRPFHMKARPMTSDKR